jgi:TRAP transporter TAXI family solute receptor
VLQGGWAALLCAASPSWAQLNRITIGANPAGTNFNVIAGGFAKLLQESLGVPSIVRPYSGSSVYIPLLERGEITLGINSSIDSYLSYTGQAPYPVRMRNIRGLMAVYPLGYMYWVKAGSEFRRVEDLRGARVVLDYRGLFVLDRLNRAILATAGLSEADVSARSAAGLPEGARLVADGRADAVAMGYRLPLVKQMHASIPGGLRFLRMGGDIGKVRELMPAAWVETVTPDATDVGMAGPTEVAMYDTFLNGSTRLMDDDAYRIVAAIHTRWGELQSSYGLLATVSADAIAPDNHPHPYHPGAVAYFKEAGLWSAAHEANQSRLLSAA